MGSVNGEIHRGRAEFSPKIRDFLKGLFAHHEGFEGDCLTAIAMVFDEKKVHLAPEGMAADIIAKWPKLQAARRNETAKLLETGMALRSSRGVLTFDEIIREMNRGRRASDLIPLVWVAHASLASEPTKEPARVAAALLSAWQRFPSLQVKWGMLLMLLPLTPETRVL